MPLPVFNKTRIAPTPSGFLHLGNVLSFALTAALARQTGAKILLRIDDLDRGRVNPLYVQDIFDTLSFLEIPYDEGPRNFAEYEREWSQLQQMDRYRQALQTLKDHNHVFACACSRAQIRNASGDDCYPGTCSGKEISLQADNVTWRLKTDVAPLAVKTLSGEVTKAILPGSMKSFVVRKKDGYPAYQLTSVLDDLYYGVDLVVRGADLWDSTLAQLYMAPKIAAHSFNNVTFYHHPLLMAPGGGKLSKSAGSISVQYLRKEGKKANDIFTGIAAMLGIKSPVTNWQALAQLVTPQR